MKASFSAWLLLAALVAGCATAPATPTTPTTPTSATTPTTAAGQTTPSTAPATASSGQQSSGPIAQKAVASTFTGLTAEEYALGEGKTLPPLGGPDGGTLPDLRAKWRGTITSRVEAINKTLAPFGYRVTFVNDPNVGHPQYTVYKGDTVVADADELWPPSVNSRGDDFVMLVELAAQGQVIRRAQAEAWNTSLHEYTTPVFAGERVVTVVNESTQGQGSPGSIRYSVMSGNEQLFAGELQWNRTDNPIKALSAWDGHWVLEVGGRVIIDGKDLGADKGYTEVFGWQLLAGKPFYYAVKDGKTSIVYGDQVFPTQYDTVVHYRCCSPAMYNNWGNQQMAGFFGQRDGRWYYVEIGKYE